MIPQKTDFILYYFYVICIENVSRNNSLTFFFSFLISRSVFLLLMKNFSVLPKIRHCVLFSILQLIFIYRGYNTWCIIPEDLSYKGLHTVLCSQIEVTIHYVVSELRKRSRILQTCLIGEPFWWNTLMYTLFNFLCFNCKINNFGLF